MFGHYLVTLYRSLTRHRLYAALNVFGLAVGIAVFLVLWLDVKFETGFEKWIPDAGQIYVVSGRYLGQMFGLGASDTSMGALLDELKADYPQLIGARLTPDHVTVLQGGRATAETLAETDPSYFQVFDLPLLYGERLHALDRPDALVLTRTKALQYFGRTDALGAPLTLTVQGKSELHRVTGVLADPPASSDLKLKMLIPLTPRIVAANAPYWAHWGSFSVSTYLRFRSSSQAAALNGDIDRFTDRHGRTDLGAHPSRQLELRVNTLLSRHLQKPRDRAIVTGLLAVGVLTLLLAAVNYVNLATARAGLRAREVALRKVMGATQAGLIAQFMAEALLNAVMAAVIGLALCELSLPLLNAAGGLNLKLHYLGRDGLVPILIVTTLAVGCGAGLYPALFLSRFRPAAVLASTRTPGGGRAGSQVRTGLVVLQFAIAIAFTVATLIILAETRFLRSADLGFRRSGLVSVTSFDDTEVTAGQRQTLLAIWKTLPGVQTVTSSDIAPGNDDSTNTTNTRQPFQPEPGLALNQVATGPDFFTTYNAHLLAGRVLDLAHGQDLKPEKGAAYRRNVVLNARAAEVLGFSTPASAIGKPLTGGNGDTEVAGVVADFRLRSPHDPVPPTVYRLTNADIDGAIASIRFAGVNPAALMAALRRSWRSVAPNAQFEGSSAEDSLETYYRPSDTNARLFTLGAVLAVAIGCVGLYGLASFNTARRVREIGIRKTLGASTADVLRLLVGQLLRPVLLANLLAWPLAWLAMRSWLDGFDQRIGLSPLYFLGASALMLCVALATVVGQALAVARAEPAKALRHE